MNRGNKDLHYLAMVAASHHSVNEDIRRNEQEPPTRITSNSSFKNQAVASKSASTPAPAQNTSSSSLSSSYSHRRFTGGKPVVERNDIARKVTIHTMDGTDTEAIRRISLFNCGSTTSEADTTTSMSSTSLPVRGPRTQFDTSRSYELEPIPLGPGSNVIPSPSSFEKKLSQQQHLTNNFEPASLEATSQRQAMPPISTTATSTTRNENISEKQMFLTFMYALYKHIDESSKSDEDVRNIKVRVRQVVKECTRSCRLKIPGYSPLMNVIERKLIEIEGIEFFWDIANQSVHNWINKRSSNNYNSNDDQTKVVKKV